MAENPANICKMVQPPSRHGDLIVVLITVVMPVRLLAAAYFYMLESNEGFEPIVKCHR